MAKSLEKYIRMKTFSAPEPMEYVVNIETAKDRNKYIKRI